MKRYFYPAIFSSGIVITLLLSFTGFFRTPEPSTTLSAIDPPKMGSFQEWGSIEEYVEHLELPGRFNDAELVELTYQDDARYLAVYRHRNVCKIEVSIDVDYIGTNVVYKSDLSEVFATCTVR